MRRYRDESHRRPRFDCRDPRDHRSGPAGVGHHVRHYVRVPAAGAADVHRVDARPPGRIGVAGRHPGAAARPLDRPCRTARRAEYRRLLPVAVPRRIPAARRCGGRIGFGRTAVRARIRGAAAAGAAERSQTAGRRDRHAGGGIGGAAGECRAGPDRCAGRTGRRGIDGRGNRADRSLGSAGRGSARWRSRAGS